LFSFLERQFRLTFRELIATTSLAPREREDLIRGQAGPRRTPANGPHVGDKRVASRLLVGPPDANAVADDVEDHPRAGKQAQAVANVLGDCDLSLGSKGHGNTPTRKSNALTSRGQAQQGASCQLGTRSLMMT
jgi:hypothetical protein